MRYLSAVALSALLVLLGCSLTAVDGQNYSTEARDGMTALQGWYNAGTGLYASPAGWWNSANSITALGDYERAAGDLSYSSVLSNTFTRAQSGTGGHANFENNYYDDTGWWALAWINTYDLTGDSRYLTMAETMFSYLTTGWTVSECGGGGMIWNTKSTYQNAVTNELFLTVAAKLANRTSGSASAGYLAWANKEWTWFEASGMINSKNLINDGLAAPPGCANNKGTEWTYNQGVILGGLVELSKGNHDPTLLTEAEAIANAVLNPSNGLVNSDGILVESSVSSSDNVQFKGIFVRNLAELYKATDEPAYLHFLTTNADSIWSHDRSSGSRFGARWQGPFDSADDVRQTSAEEALIAALAAAGGNGSGH